MLVSWRKKSPSGKNHIFNPSRNEKVKRNKKERERAREKLTKRMQRDFSRAQNLKKPAFFASIIFTTGILKVLSPDLVIITTVHHV